MYPYRFGYISDLREKRLLTEVKDRTNDATNRHLAGWNQHPIQPRKPTTGPGPTKGLTEPINGFPGGYEVVNRNRTGTGPTTVGPPQRPPTGCKIQDLETTVLTNKTPAF